MKSDLNSLLIFIRRICTFVVSISKQMETTPNDSTEKREQVARATRFDVRLKSLNNFLSHCFVVIT
jgi:hypothetical protein